MSKDVIIAGACGSPEGPLIQIAEFVEKQTGKSPKLTRLPDLAGPNETIQLLGDIDFWKGFFIGVAALYGKGFFGELGKSNAQSVLTLFKKKTKEDFVSSELQPLFNAIETALRCNGNVVFGVTEKPIHQGYRNIGFEILDPDPAAICYYIYILSENAAKIEKKLIEWNNEHKDSKSASYVSNNDCSVKLSINEEGIIFMEANIRYGDSAEVEKKMCYFD